MTTAPPETRLTRDELHLIVALAADCSLDESPGTNWVQEAGGLPDYICQIARAIKRDGKLTSSAIAIAVNRAKVWSTGKGVSAKTQAKAAAALAQWEKLRAKSRAKSAAKAVGSMGAKMAGGSGAKAAMAAGDSAAGVIMLAAGQYPVSIVCDAFNARVQAARQAWREQNPGQDMYDAEDAPASLWIKEQWNTFLIVQSSDHGSDPDLYKIPYTVDTTGDDPEVSFGDPVQVVSQYVEVSDLDADAATMPDAALEKLVQASGPCPRATGAARLLQLSARRPAPPTALSRVLAFSDAKAYAHTKANKYADPGYQSDGRKRYALDTPAQVRSAWSYISQKDNASKYSSEDLVKVKAAIKAAARKFGVEIND